jgi:hypothetical protein
MAEETKDKDRSALGAVTREVRASSSLSFNLTKEGGQFRKGALSTESFRYCQSSSGEALIELIRH